MESSRKVISNVSWSDLQRIVPLYEEQEHWDGLWEIAKCLPVEGAVRVLSHLARIRWTPEKEREAYSQLSSMALDCERASRAIRSMTFDKVSLEQLVAVKSFVYDEVEDRLIAVDLNDQTSRVRVWKLSTGALITTINGPSMDQGIFEPIQLVCSNSGDYLLTVHLGGHLCLWSIEHGTAQTVSVPDFSAELNARPFAAYEDNRFIIGGFNSKVAYLHPHTMESTVLTLQEDPNYCAAITPGKDRGDFFVLVDGGTIFMVEPSRNVSIAHLDERLKKASALMFSPSRLLLYVGTRRGEMVSLNPDSGLVQSSSKIPGIDAVLSIVEVVPGRTLLTGHPDGFGFWDMSTLELLVFIPRANALPKASAGQAMYVTSDREHIMFRDYNGALFTLSYRFALLSVIPCANMTAEMLAWLETRTAESEWAAFVQAFSGHVVEGTLTPNWTYEVHLPEAIAAESQERSESDSASETHFTHIPEFSDTFGKLPEDDE